MLSAVSHGAFWLLLGQLSVLLLQVKHTAGQENCVDATVLNEADLAGLLACPFGSIKGILTIAWAGVAPLNASLSFEADLTGLHISAASQDIARCHFSGVLRVFQAMTIHAALGMTVVELTFDVLAARAPVLIGGPRHAGIIGALSFGTDPSRTQLNSFNGGVTVDDGMGQMETIVVGIAPTLGTWNITLGQSSQANFSINLLAEASTFNTMTECLISVAGQSNLTASVGGLMGWNGGQIFLTDTATLHATFFGLEALTLWSGFVLLDRSSARTSRINLRNIGAIESVFSLAGDGYDGDLTINDVRLPREAAVAEKAVTDCNQRGLYNLSSAVCDCWLPMFAEMGPFCTTPTTSPTTDPPLNPSTTPTPTAATKSATTTSIMVATTLTAETDTQPKTPSVVELFFINSYTLVFAGNMSRRQAFAQQLQAVVETVLVGASFVVLPGEVLVSEDQVQAGDGGTTVAQVSLRDPLMAASLRASVDAGNVSFFFDNQYFLALTSLVDNQEADGDSSPGVQWYWLLIVALLVLLVVAAVVRHKRHKVSRYEPYSISLSPESPDIAMQHLFSSDICLEEFDLASTSSNTALSRPLSSDPGPVSSTSPSLEWLGPTGPESLSYPSPCSFSPQDTDGFDKFLAGLKLPPRPPREVAQWTPLALALCTSSNGDISRFQQLLIEGAQPDEEVGSSGKTCLHMAVETAQLEAARLLLQAGCAVDALDHELMTPLMYACQLGHVALVELLLQSQVNESLANNAGQTALIIACIRDQPTIAQLLTRTTTSVAHADVKGRTAFHWVAAVDGKECMRALLEADPLLQTLSQHDHGGQGFIHLAATNGSWSVLELSLALLSAFFVRALLLDSNGAGYTAQEVAEKACFSHMEQFLQDSYERVLLNTERSQESSEEDQSRPKRKRADYMRVRRAEERLRHDEMQAEVDALATVNCYLVAQVEEQRNQVALLRAMAEQTSTTV